LFQLTLRECSSPDGHMRNETRTVLASIVALSGASGYCEATHHDLCAAADLPANVVRFSIGWLQQRGFLAVYPQSHGITTYALTTAAQAAISTPKGNQQMSLNNTPPAPTTGEVAKPQMQSTTAPVVNGVATSNALKGAGSVSVHQSPPAHDQAGWAGVSPVVNNTPTTNL
jgi:hypothetical protein